ncbi:hypothetical protein AB0O91_09755 [Kitasatospora sp. NPDC089797]|uniref:hypothetical protein n=1 Tax=Kitasatospora sp. NPDC089797 TaxID=3155298 RepID=UPI0034264FEE
MAAPLHAVLGPLPAAPYHRRDRCDRCAERRARGARPGGRARTVFAAAVLGLTLPLAAATLAAAEPAPSVSAQAGERPARGGDEAADEAVGADESAGRDRIQDDSQGVDGAWVDDGADGTDGSWDGAGPPGQSPRAAPPQYPVPERSRPDFAEFRAHRHRPASAPDQAPDQVPDQAPGQTAEQAPDQAPDRSVGQAPDQPQDQAQDQAQDQGAAVDGSDPDASAPAADPDTAAVAAGRPEAAIVPAVLPARWQDPSTLQLPLGVGLGLIGCGLGLVGVRLRKG